MRDKKYLTKINSQFIINAYSNQDTDGIVKIGHGNQYPSIRYFMEELKTNSHSLKILGDNGQSQIISLQFPLEPVYDEEEPYVTMGPVRKKIAA